MKRDLAREAFPHTVPRVISLLRFVGVMNAAVWLGGSTFHLFAVAPFFAAPAPRWILGDLHATGVGLMLGHRFYYLQYICLGIAWTHLLAEWVYLGKTVSKFNAWCLSVLLVLALVGHAQLTQVVEPTHWNRKNPKISSAERDRADRIHPIWRTVWFTTDILLTLGVLGFSARLLTAHQGPRFMTQGRFRTPESLEA